MADQHCCGSKVPADSSNCEMKETLGDMEKACDVKKGDGENPTLGNELHRSLSSSSSSSEEEGEEGEKKKKKKSSKDKATEGEIPGNEGKAATGHDEGTDEKKGFVEKIKEKLPGHEKKAEVDNTESPAEKKGILEKIKDKLPGCRSKDEEGDKDKDN